MRPTEDKDEGQQSRERGISEEAVEAAHGWFVEDRGSVPSNEDGEVAQGPSAPWCDCGGATLTFL